MRRLREAAKLGSKLKEMTEALETLPLVAKVLSGPGEFEPKLARALSLVADAVAVRGAGLWAPDARNGKLLALPQIVGSGRTPPRVLPMDESLSGQAFTEGQPVVVNTGLPDDRRFPLLSHRPARSAASFPVRHMGTVIAVLTLSAGEPEHFTPHRVQLLEIIADSLGVLVRNAELQAAERDQTRSLDALLLLSQALSSSDEMSVKLSTVVAIVGNLCDATTAALFELDQDGEHSRATARLPHEEPHEGRRRLKVRRTFKSGSTLVYNDLTSETSSHGQRVVEPTLVHGNLSFT